MDQANSGSVNLLQSLNGHMTCLDTGRWLSTLPTSLLMDLIQLSGSESAYLQEGRLRVLRILLVAENIMRPGESEPSLDFYIRRLGGCASAEYAFRRDWVWIFDTLALAKSPCHHRNRSGERAPPWESI